MDLNTLLVSHIRMAYDRLAAQYPPKRDSIKGQRQEVMKTEVGPAGEDHPCTLTLLPSSSPGAHLSES